MRGTMLVFKKELREFAKDRKTVVMTFAMPLLVYSTLFLMIAHVRSRSMDQLNRQASRVVLVDPDGLLRSALAARPDRIALVRAPEGDVRHAILQQRVDLEVVIGDGAGAQRQRQLPVTVTITRDESETGSQLAFDRIRAILDTVDGAVVRERLASLRAEPTLTTPSEVVVREAASGAQRMAKSVGAFLPYLLMMMLLQGAVRQGIYTTAGERERGTMLSLLSTALTRGEIIRGKLLFIFGVGVANALANVGSLAVGTMLGGLAAAEPRTAAVARAGAGAIEGLTLLDPVNLLLVFCLIVPLGLLFSNVVLLAGISARTSAAAGVMLAPLFVFILLVGAFTMTAGVDQAKAIPYLPVVNVSVAIKNQLAQRGNGWEYIVALLMTLVLTALLTWKAAKVLDREEVLFRS